MRRMSHIRNAGVQRISLRQIAHTSEVKPPFRSLREPMPRIGSRMVMARWFVSRVSMAAKNSSQAMPPSRAPGLKRGLDLACIGISLPLILPLMVLIACWIRLTSKGPALLRQMRVGRAGLPFELYKFRSMQINSDSDRHESYIRRLVKTDKPMIKLNLLCDSELIAGGCWLRASGLDELPQLLNVLRGEMSLVGPRPCLPAEHALFSPGQLKRFAALPGLTGIWQVYGKNRATFHEMNVMDLHYVRHASLRMDLQIILRTPAALLSQMLLAWQHKRAAGKYPAH